MSDNKTLAIEEVKHVAKLARLVLTDNETTSMQRDLTNILQYVRKLDELDTKNVEPTAHAVEVQTELRADEVKPGLPIDKALKNAPERMGDGFGVPKIIE